MKPEIHVEVEPLSESRWSKIEAGVFSELEEPAAPAEVVRPRFSRRTVVSIGAVFAAAAALAAVVGRSVVTGEARAPEASRIVTGASPSHVALASSTLDVGPDSAVVASGDDARGLLVVVEKGSVDCEVAPRKNRPPFVVLAGDVRVRVVGTRFVVTRASEGVSVKVEHGTVEVTRGAEVVMLHDGERWAETPVARAPDPQPVEPPAPAPAPAPLEASAPKPHGKAPATAGSHGASTDADRKAFERAAALEVREPETAMGTYRRLGAGSGPWAGPALYAAGRLAADRGRSAEARTLLGQYTTRFPNGANATDAARLLGELR